MGTDPERDWGYVEMPHIKEFWQMRHGDACEHPFRDVGGRFFRMATDICETALKALARGISTNEENFVDALVDAHDADLSSTIYRFFHYYDTGHAAGCQVHTDIGLITLIPASTLPALEVMDFESFRWYNFEKPLHPDDVMILCGETLERHSGYYYRAVVHRVTPLPSDRTSLVFLMRARPDGVLDPVSLRSSVLGEVDFGLREPITVARFMRLKYLNKRSANFVDPGQGLPGANLRGEAPSAEEIERWRDQDAPEGDNY